MSKFDGEWSSRLVVAVAFLLTGVMFTSSTRAQVSPSPKPQARKRMVQAVDKTLQEGMHAGTGVSRQARRGAEREYGAGV